MVVGVPNWDIFKGPKQITKSKRKPQPIEQEIVEESSKEQSGDKNDAAEVADQAESGAERLATEDIVEVTEEQVVKMAQRRAVQKEKRSKKRNEKPEFAEEDQPVRAPKRKKTVVSKQKAADSSKGKNSKPNTDSVSSAQPPTQSPPIDYTQPIRMIPPSPQPSSPSSEGTSSDASTDSSELIEKLDKLQKEQSKKKIPAKRTLKKRKHNSPEEENIFIDTSILDQPTNTIRKSSTILEHLSTHLSGDAFTYSNTNSPDQFHFVNASSDLPIDPPIPEPPIQTSPTFTPAQDEVMNHSEHTIAEPSTPQPEPSTLEPSPEPQTPQSEPIYGPSYKPLTIDELSLPTDFALPILEDLLKAEINVDDDIITTPKDPFAEIRKIKIIPLKRKRPEPTIPFNKNQPFFNHKSEPNLELLDNAISISLKKFKSMEEEVLIFPSDVDAKIRELEQKFSQSLRLLGGYVKRKIEGRGMEVLSQIMSAADRSHALRLTFFNHEEECQRLAFLAAVNESLRRSLDAEQARIAAEMERQRLADQEAFKLLVDRAVRIAVVETEKIIENQAAAEDVVMQDQNLSESDSDKGKAPIVASTPPRSPPVLIQGSSSSAIPSVMQEALDVIKNDLREELRNEMDEFRADIREDMNRSGEATNKKIDDMMVLLLKITQQQQPKP
ncbi:hypothetical protein QL285_076809 [Trifolium repens]|nr:hypothetical protein QL285_076809 [Trifolium repens]